MKMSEVFLRAGELVASGAMNHTCFAIEEVDDAPQALDMAREWYADNVLCGEIEPIVLWHDIQNPSERKHARVLALCFAAAIAESEGL